MGIITSFNAHLQVTDPNGDFFSRSIVTSFSDGATSASAVGIILNDNIPEGNETFTLTITSVSSGATIGARSTLSLTIRANDEPYGLLQFHMVMPCNAM